MSVKSERRASKGVARQKRVQGFIVFSIFAVVATPRLLRHSKNRRSVVQAVLGLLGRVAGDGT